MLNGNENMLLLNLKCLYFVADRMKPAVIAKLCQQCEELYADTYKCMSKEMLKPLWDRDWLARVAGKQLAFSALAHFYQSRVRATCVTQSVVLLIQSSSCFLALLFFLKFINYVEFF